MYTDHVEYNYDVVVVVIFLHVYVVIVTCILSIVATGTRGVGFKTAQTVSLDTATHFEQ